VQAGLTSVTVKGRISTALSLGHRPHEAVRAAWDVLTTEDERFVTLAVAVLDPTAGTLQWVNAGHEPPLLRRADGTIERLDATGPLVSSMIDPSGRPWDTARTHLAPGDLLVLATDGLSEARNAQGEEFGTDRIEQALRAMTATDPQSAIAGLYGAADRHGIDWQRDDVTVLAARVTPGPDAGPTRRRARRQR
jgi:serine phosphatase RsbU (regulator of sigma subunit)